VSDIACQQHLQSANCRQLFIQCHWRSMFDHLSISVAGLMVWSGTCYQMVLVNQHVPLTVSGLM